MLLCLVKHSKPDIANITLTLLMINDSSSKAAFLEMHHETNFVLEPRNLGLNIEPTEDGEEQGTSSVSVTVIMQVTQ